jgi:aminopeptidase N
MRRLAVLACLLWAISPGALTAAAQTPAREVLPDGVTPSHYELAIRPDLTALTFTGVNAITIDVRAPTSDIVLNSDGLVFDKAALETGAAGTAAYDQKLGRATIHFGAPVGAGRHVLTIAYHGKIGKETLGLFAMDYDSANGRRRTLGTNLEPTGARQVFPGWDEPGLKATYRVTVDAPKDRMAISNMPVASVAPVSSTTDRVTFAQSPKMSSYLFFLGIGDWERIHQQVDGVDVGVVVNRGDTAKGRYALLEAARLLHWYNGYFGVAYPLPKMDLIAAPGQIQGGSMENWGAIFYSQNHLLFDPAGSTEEDRQEVFQVVAHEMAHQWFGDLVTMNWWDNLWLNEGFARWMQTYVADALHPEWQTGLKAQSIFEAGKAQDALPSTHPVVQPIATANQAGQAFDGITYDKGAAVITMLTHYIGDDAFRTGVQRYMKAHAYGNTVDADLWGVMEKGAGKPILAIEHDFTANEGLPLIRVAQGEQGLHLAEDRFTVAGPKGEAARNGWRIPLTVARVGTSGEQLLLNDAAEVDITGPALVNAGQTAYARVLYPQPAFEALLPHVGAMAAVDQIGLTQDSLALGMAGYAPASNALAMAAATPATADPLVWKRIAGMLGDIDHAYGESPDRAGFRRYAIRLLKPALAALGEAKAGELSNVPIVRAQLTEALGEFGDADTVAAARALVQAGAGTPVEQRTALKIAGAKADAAFFDALLAKARSTRDPLEKMHLYQALAGVEDPALARRAADVALSDEAPAGTNVSIIFPLANAHPDLAWTLIVPRLADPKAGIVKQTQWRVAGAIAGLSSDEARIAQLQDYIARNVPEDARAPLQGSIASIRQRHRIAQEVLPEIDAWLAKQPA